MVVGSLGRDSVLGSGGEGVWGRGSVVVVGESGAGLGSGGGESGAGLGSGGEGVWGRDSVVVVRESGAGLGSGGGGVWGGTR